MSSSCILRYPKVSVLALVLERPALLMSSAGALWSMYSAVRNVQNSYLCSRHFPSIQSPYRSHGSRGWSPLHLLSSSAYKVNEPWHRIFKASTDLKLQALHLAPNSHPSRCSSARDPEYPRYSHLSIATMQSEEPSSPPQNPAPALSCPAAQTALFPL